MSILSENPKKKNCLEIISNVTTEREEISGNYDVL